MQGLVLEDESFGADESGLRRKAILLSNALSLSLAAATLPGRLFSLFWPTNKLRSCQTIFLSWMTCFHQNKILIGELNLFSREE